MRILVLLSASLLIGCAQAPESAVLRIATDATFPPFHYRQQDEVTGFEIALARAVATGAGQSAEILVLPYDRLWSGLEDGSHDIVAASTGITAERERRYLFSSPYFATCQAVVVRAQSEAMRAEDLAGSTVGAEGSGTSFLALQSLPVRHRAQLTDGEGPRRIESGEIDAWIVDEFAGVRVVEASAGRLRVLPGSVAHEQYAFVMARDRVALKARVDAALAEIDNRGQLAELAREFGVFRDPDWPVRCGSD